MVSILINWGYVLIILCVSGHAFIRLHNKLIGDNRTGSLPELLFLGIMVTTVYAQIFSIWGSLGLFANVLLLLLLSVVVVSDRKYIIARLKSIEFPSLSLSLIILLMLMVFSASSAGVEKLIDTEWYHAQNIRWLEEYGCVRGVANLLYPLGFNSPQHYFDALFSMKWIFGQSIRFSGGLFGVIICLHGLLRLRGFRTHLSHIADAVAVGEIVYSVIITAFFTDPYTDTLPNILILFIVCEAAAMIEEKRVDINAMSLLCVLGVFATAVKSSAAMIIPLVILPAVSLLKNRRIKQIIIYLAEGIAVCVPYFITNTIVSGYPVFLLSSVSFNLDWRIDPSVLRYSVDDMKAFARMPGVPMQEALNCGLMWVPIWFRNESLSHQILYIAILIMIILDIALTITEVVQKRKISWELLLIRVCSYLGLAYWFFTIPQVKYCWAYLILPLCIVPMSHKDFNKYLMALVKVLAAAVGLLYLGFYSLRTVGYTKDGVINNPIIQHDYLEFSFEEMEIDGMRFFVRGENSDIACGYYVFPQFDFPDRAEELVHGNTYRDGFYYRR